MSGDFKAAFNLPNSPVCGHVFLWQALGFQDAGEAHAGGQGVSWVLPHL